jgi:voltage-gated sodium channel
MRERIKTLVEASTFQRIVITVIVLNAITLGLQTSDQIEASYGGTLDLFDTVVLAFFIAELTLRLYVYRWRFFTDPWSVFDFLVVGIALVPSAGNLSVLRALRILRAMRLVSQVPGMKRVVSGLLSAIPGMVSIIALLGLVNYVGAVLATEMYGGSSEHFRSLPKSLFTLFQVMTGEAWPDIANDVLPEHPGAWIFFVIFILVSTFVVLNLFTAVIVGAMEPERREDAVVDATVLTEIRALRAEIAALRADREKQEATSP